MTHSKKLTPKHKLLKTEDKEKILKAVRNENNNLTDSRFLIREY